MLAEAEQHGLRVYPKHNVTLHPNPDGVMHDSRGNTLTQFYRKCVRSWDTGVRGKPTVHQSVLIRTRNRNNAEKPPYDPWIRKLKYEVEPWPESLRTIILVNPRDALAEGIENGIVQSEDSNVVIKDGKVIKKDVDKEKFPDLPIISSEEAFDRMSQRAKFNLEQETKALEQARTQSKGYFQYILLFSVVGFLLIVVGITLIYLNYVNVGIIMTFVGIVPEALAAILCRKYNELRGVDSSYITKVNKSQVLLALVNRANTITNEKDRNVAKSEIINSILSRI